jgi:DNA-binding MarR family transcriptional regulator
MCLAHTQNLNARDIAEVSGRSKNSISRATTLLLQKGFISEVVDELDRRHKILRLEDAGLAFYRETIPRFKQRQQKMLSVLTKEETVIFDVLLNKLILRSDDWEMEY